MLDSKRRKVGELLNAQRLPEARVVLEEICQKDPRDFISWMNLGAVCGNLKAFSAAERAFKMASTLCNGDPKPHMHLIRLCELQGRFAEAVVYYQNYLKLVPDDAEAYVGMGRLLHSIGRLEEAVSALRQALRCNPNNAAYYNNLGIVQSALGRNDDAVKSYQECLRLNPRVDAAYCNLGNLFKDSNDFVLAEQNYIAALEINPGNFEARKNLGHTLRKMGRLDDALLCFQKLLQLHPSVPEAHLYYSTCKFIQGDLDGAMRSNDEVLRLDPSHAEAHFSRACYLLSLGDYREGWQEYEWRFKYDRLKAGRIVAHQSARPLWHGEPLTGKTLLIYAEQGFGDTLQFCRYLPMVRQRVEKVVFECQSELIRLLSSCFNDIEFIPYAENLESLTVNHDVQISLMSLPLLFNTEIDSIPNGDAYIHADPQQVGHWQRRLDTTAFKVGLVWAGRPTHVSDQERSMRLEVLAPLAQVQNVCFFALQKGPASAQADTPPAGMELIKLSDELEDFSTTAAIIANLDLVITVDTSVAHLAGAMGKPVWVLIYSPPDWRWLRNCEDSPWYPTMRLFRQAAPGEWGPVIERVAAELQRESNRNVMPS